MNISLETFAVLKGHLYVIATPIGHLGDITLRSIETLKQLDLIACEDTRVTKKLLEVIGIHKPLISYHDNNETTQAMSLVEKLKSGLSVGLVCDAGTPGISDPGFRVVRECKREGIPVIPIPGPSAITTALSVAGLPTNGFFYAGFLPPKQSARIKFFETYRSFPYTIVLYESCHRIERCVEDLIECLSGQRVICVGREMTKKFETYLTGKAQSVKEELKGKNLKGEFVLLIAPEDYIL